MTKAVLYKDVVCVFINWPAGKKFWGTLEALGKPGPLWRREVLHPKLDASQETHITTWQGIRGRKIRFNEILQILGAKKFLNCVCLKDAVP